MKNEIKLGDKVRKVENDYTNGRTGVVIEIQNQTPNEENLLFMTCRYRVHWTQTAAGNLVNGKVKGLKTWCKPERLELI